MKERKRGKKADDRVREQPMTYEQYAEMPDDGMRYEIFDGKLEMMTPGPMTNHQSVSVELEVKLHNSCRTDYLVFDAPIDVILSPTNVLQPDILMIHRSRLSIVGRHGIEGPPDLVVEIVSPGSIKRDTVVKMRIYERFGVNEYWIVDASNRTLAQHRLGEDGSYAIVNLFEGDDTVVSDTLPCVAFTLSDIFREIIDQ